MCKIHPLARFAFAIMKYSGYLLGLNQWIENLPNNKDISKDKAYGYIKDIEIMSNNLLNKYKTEVSLTVQDEAYHCVSITSEIVRASTLAQLKCKIAAMTLAIDLPQECYGVFVNINSSLFKRILINLINNAIEAKPKSNAIHIKLGCTDSSVQISINDDGKGIPKNILSKLGKEEVTHGKDDGHGIGLYHATQTVTSWGGKLKILSEDGHGTTISIILPRTDPPGWFTPYINLSGINKIVIIDDDQNIHDQWKDKLKAIEQISLEHLYSPDQAFTYLSKSLFSNDTLFLVDYQIANYERTGIDIITKSNITSKAILVTGRSDEPEIANACIQHSIHLIPKDDIPLLPLAKYL
jgi:hypothetical protein